MFMSRLKRQLLARPRFARIVFTILLLVALLGISRPGLAIIRLVFAPLPSQLTLIHWQTSQPPEITLLRYDIPNRKIAISKIDPDTQIPSLNLPISQVFDLGQTKDGSRGGLILAKSSVSELDYKPPFTILITNVTLASYFSSLSHSPSQTDLTPSQNLKLILYYNLFSRQSTL
jgi:hypothetical protein